MNSKILAVDFGATKILGALFSEKGKIFKKVRTDTQADLGREKILENLIKVISKIKDRETSAISIGAPGPMDFETGTILGAPNLPGWDKVPLKKILKEQFKLPVFLDNDAICALRGEVFKGVGRGKKNVLMLTLGSGVGGAVLVKGEYFLGKAGHGPELGHQIFDPKSNLTCQAGHPGDLEAFLGGKIWDKRTGKSLKELFRDKGFIKEWARRLNQSINYLVGKFHPEVIILSGGVTKDFGKFKVLIKTSVPVVLAKLGEDSVLYGAYKLANENIKS